MVRPTGVQNSGMNPCTICGIPADAGWFDNSSIQEAPRRLHEEVVLASYRVPREYCGQLVYFSQYAFTNSRAGDPFHTPDYEWSIRIDGRRLSPYAALDHIVNPWGIHGFPIHIRLNGDNDVQFVIRCIKEDGNLSRVGGRLMGRYWYNNTYG
ncbi:hypothetical protein [Brevibacillus dissolubilis]|uniref:hypothetical protein n=1 Tax=Brevibacillus dissolubilis TaxID=1844116 RepID=UPI0011175395|nr:hypothetical protein [Brevibacillus dissolubilis]